MNISRIEPVGISIIKQNNPVMRIFPVQKIDL